MGRRRRGMRIAQSYSTVSDYGPVISEMDRVLSVDPEGISDKARAIFQAHARLSKCSRELFPKWWDAFDALPETGKFSLINVVERDVSLDIIKRAAGLPVGMECFPPVAQPAPGL